MLGGMRETHRVFSIGRVTLICISSSLALLLLGMVLVALVGVSVIHMVVINFMLLTRQDLLV